MIPILVVFVLAFFYLFSSPAIASKNYGAKVCANDDKFYCYQVKRKDSWEKLFPDENQKEVVMKLNRMNTRLHAGMTIAIPKNANITVLDLSPFQKQISPPGEKVIFVSLTELAWGAYDSNGTLVNWGPASGGQGYCPDIHTGCHTPTGNFAVYRKEGFECKSTKFPVGRGGAPMPYCMFFHGGLALHGSYEVPGYNASHGCVRIFVNDAEWLNEDFVGDDNVPIIIRQL